MKKIRVEIFTKRKILMCQMEMDRKRTRPLVLLATARRSRRTLLRPALKLKVSGRNNNKLLLLLPKPVLRLKAPASDCELLKLRVVLVCPLGGPR